MPSHRKSKSKQTKSKGATNKRPKKKPAKQTARQIRPKKAAKKKQSKKTSSRKPARKKKTLRGGTQRRGSVRNQGSGSGRQTGDLQGLSRVEQADSESVDELVEEGNIFEAGAVAGVEEADNAEERELQVHEVPEDDVPDEYLDKD